MSGATLWSWLWFNYILAELKQLTFLVPEVILFKDIISALPLDSHIFGIFLLLLEWTRVLQLIMNEAEVI